MMSILMVVEIVMIAQISKMGLTLKMKKLSNKLIVTPQETKFLKKLNILEMLSTTKLNMSPVHLDVKTVLVSWEEDFITLIQQFVVLLSLTDLSQKVEDS
jgi:hypothetical protein